MPACLSVTRRVGFTSAIIGRIVNWEFSSLPSWGTTCRDCRRCRDPSSRVSTGCGAPRKVSDWRLNRCKLEAVWGDKPYIYSLEGIFAAGLLRFVAAALGSAPLVLKNSSRTGPGCRRRAGCRVRRQQNWEGGDLETSYCKLKQSFIRTIN